ncbi:hypothetical protein K353_05938 [Kitasatospora sp. SolWspMP-SS2h]|nr:hypothetical protein K353_05938 [Kitasatospora sp. SolWspMP-SS2h]
MITSRTGISDQLLNPSKRHALGPIQDAPHKAVVTLIRYVMRIADGLLLAPSHCATNWDLEKTVAAQSGEDDPDRDNVAVRLTPLDPWRPARDLLCRCPR